MLERLLLHLDVGAGLAAVRFALGALLAVGLRACLPGAGVGTALIALAGLLFSLKLLAAVARRLAPASARVRAVWEWRRTLARRHDSFQWRKLLWVGAGILAAALAGPRGGWEAALGGGCVVAGALGEVIWRTKGLSSLPPVGG